MNYLPVILMMGGGEEQNPYMSFIMLFLIIVVFYFFMIRPQMKKQKESKTFREGLKNGDKIVTIGGIYGKIIEVAEQTIIIEVENKMRLKVDKNGVVKDSSDIMVQK